MASRPEPEPVTVIPRAVPPDQASLASLLQFEAEVRRQRSVNELVWLTANEARRIIAYDQMFVLRRPLAGSGFRVMAASSLASVDRNAPLIQAIEKVAGQIDCEQPQQVDPLSLSSDPSLTEYPFHSWFWQPLRDSDDRAFAGLLLARGEPFRDAEAIRLERIADTISHGWRALSGNKPVNRIRKPNRREKRGLVLIGVLVALFPVRMSVLAPVEVVPEHPFVVAAPYAGVIARVEVAPNSMVKAGAPVLTFEDVKVRNELQQAGEKLRVARARIERSTSASFDDREQARDIATLRAEYELAQADYNFARDIMAKSQITAPMGGMAIFSDRRDIEGRAVNPGDPIMQIADPRRVRYRVDMPAREQLALKPGGDVKIWLDAQPLWALDGKVERASYQARQTAEGILAFAVTARPVGAPPRIGSRGTAKLYGSWAPLSYALLKRPIASFRQFAGL